MPRYVVLFNWTDQGVRTAGESMRQQESQGAFQQMGLRLETVLWTHGRYDLVAIARRATTR